MGGYRGMSGYWNEYGNILTVGTVHYYVISRRSTPVMVTNEV